MILHDLVGSEHNPIYQELQISNNERQYQFLRSIVDASIKVGRPFLSSVVIKALNFHAITCLHTSAGEYRPCEVTVGSHRPPPHYLVDSLMADLINQVNFEWKAADPVTLAAFVLWRLNFIHPFINGNGRTARAACYFVLCVRAGGWLPGAPILPELIKRERPAYVAALEMADKLSASGASDFLKGLHQLLTRLLQEQLGNPPLLPAP